MYPTVTFIFSGGESDVLDSVDVFRNKKNH